MTPGKGKGGGASIGQGRACAVCAAAFLAGAVAGPGAASFPEGDREGVRGALQCFW